ncbi:MAG TPA: DUF6391 domain-containing protein [Anaerolineales bacterium]|nr:DUF6391 domain-containing protein [Anaerolineales bacterium]
MNILDFPYILETRRNHALEHATLHMLARTHKINMAGHSNPTGFFILGELLTEDIRSSLNEAYQRLRSGESELAIHPGCGTNLVATAFLPGTLAWLPFQGARSNRGRLLLLPLAILLGVFGFFLSKPVGTWMQRNITTEANLGNLQIVDVTLVRKGVHRIITK